MDSVGDSGGGRSGAGGGAGVGARRTGDADSVVVGGDWSGAIPRSRGGDFTAAGGSLSVGDLSGIPAGSGGTTAAEDARDAGGVWGIGRVGQHRRSRSFVARGAAGDVCIRAGAASAGRIDGAEGAGGSEAVGDSGGDAGGGVDGEAGGADAVAGAAARAGADRVSR